MCRQRSIWVLVLGAVLAMAGCGDDSGGGAGSGGSGATGGTGGTGADAGSGGSAGTGGTGLTGPAANTCEAFCAATCQFGALDPDETGVGQCLDDCATFQSTFLDDCGPEAEAFIACCEDNLCNCANANCLEVNQAWTACNSPQ